MLCSARDDDEDVFAAMLRDKKVIAARAAAGESPFLEIVVLDWTPWSRESSGQKIVVAAKYARRSTQEQHQFYDDEMRC